MAMAVRLALALGFDLWQCGTQPQATPPLLVSWVERLRRQRWTGAEIAQTPRRWPASCGARAWPGCASSSRPCRSSARIGRVGHRITGDRRTEVRGIGWEYVHVAVDDASGLAYVEVLPDDGGTTTTQFLWRARGWFRRHGIRIGRVLTDIAPVANRPTEVLSVLSGTRCPS